MSTIIYYIPVDDRIAVVLREQGGAIRSHLVQQLSGKHGVGHFTILMADVSGVVVDDSQSPPKVLAISKGNEFYTIHLNDLGKPTLQAVDQSLVTGKLTSPLEFARTLDPTISQPWDYTYLPKSLGIPNDTVLAYFVGVVVLCGLVFFFSRRRVQKGAESGTGPI